MPITPETQVRDIAVKHPTAIPVLERLGIDYCCGGQHTLAEACKRRDIEIAPLLEELARRSCDIDPGSIEWREVPIQNLVRHIVENHHAFARRHLDLLRELSAKVERRHGGKHPEIFKIGTALAAIATELSHHFFCEESTLFPYIVSLEADPHAPLPPTFGSVEQPVTRMMMEHDHTGNELRLIREITNNYELPADACTTYRALYRALQDLERDLHRHIHLENNILFPRALKQAGKSA